MRLIRVRWELLKIQHTLMSMESQRENSIRNLSHIADFRLKYCILKEDTKNKISGSNVAPSPLVCLRNRQTDPPRIKIGTQKESRFLL